MKDKYALHPFYPPHTTPYLSPRRTPKKPKSKKISFASGLHPSLATEKKDNPTSEGTRDTPIALDGEDKRLKLDAGVGIAADAEHVGQKRKRQNSVINENGKRKKVVDESLFHPDLQVAIKELKELIAKGAFVEVWYVGPRNASLIFVLQSHGRTKANSRHR